MTIRNLTRLGRHAILGGGLLFGWASAGQLQAQPMPPTTPPAAAPSPAAPQRNYLNKRTIQLPIHINESARSSIQEIQLYIKESPTSPWVQREKVQPTQKAFTFEAPKDGEFWFTMVTVDKQGKSYPADVRNEPPGLAVIIDTQAPVVEMTNLGTVPEGQVVQVDVGDANLDNAKVRFSYQAGDKGFRTLEPVPGRNNLFCIPSQAVYTGLVQVIAEDMAGNQTTRQEHLNHMKAPQQQANATQPASGNTQPGQLNPDPKNPAPNPLPSNVVNSAPAIDGGQTHQVQKITPAPEQPNMRPNGSDGPHWNDEKANGPAKTGAADRPREGSGELVQTSSKGSGPSLQPTALKKAQLVNNPKVSLHYQIENAAPNGVSRVDVWLSRDQGQTWQKHAEVNGNKSPIEVQMPGDGTFGLILAPAAASGLVTPPSAADQADAVWLEVDATKPDLQIKDIQTSHDKGQAAVQVRWTAHDKNLADAPVDLLYAATPRGPWILIAKGLPAEGQYRWTPPAGIGTQTHLQLVAHDSAGNSAVCGTVEPVTIAEPARPRAVIRTITTGPQQ